jgi:hypothetical protein
MLIKAGVQPNKIHRIKACTLTFISSSSHLFDVSCLMKCVN